MRRHSQRLPRNPRCRGSSGSGHSPPNDHHDLLTTSSGSALWTVVVVVFQGTVNLTVSKLCGISMPDG